MLPSLGDVILKAFSSPQLGLRAHKESIDRSSLLVLLPMQNQLEDLVLYLEHKNIYFFLI